MLKYVNYDIVFSEIPNETTLAINISNCPCQCKGCHSSYLAEDIGKELNCSSLSNLIHDNKGITCIAFMGGDSDPKAINDLAFTVKLRSDYPYKVAWYSGRQKLSPEIFLDHFDYIKLGPYTEELGGLKSPTTNQRLYKIIKDRDAIWTLEDITNVFWK